MSNRRDIQFTYNPHNKGTLLDCTFTVDPTNANGFGVSALNKSGRIATVFMHTSATPGTAINGQLNPNPASGYIFLTLSDNYNLVLGGFERYVSALSGTSVSVTAGLTVGQVYVITALGTTTQANWQALGLPSYIQAAVGVSFVASTSSAGSGTGTVQTTVSANIDHIEEVGNANLMNSSGASILGGTVGQTYILACYKNGTLTAPTALSQIRLGLYLNNSVIGV